MCGALVLSIAMVAGNGERAPKAYGGRCDWLSTTPSAHKRAGCPEIVSKRAVQTYTSNYQGYYVGGGSSKRSADPRMSIEGTYGLDYQGPRWLPRRVALGWWHGRKYQGGTGAYKTEGPHVPDIPNAVRPIKKFEGEH